MTSVDVNSLKSLLLSLLPERYQKMNENNLISQDLVKVIENHLRKIRLGVTERQPFSLQGFLISPEEEMEHIRVISDFLLTILLPSSYALCVPLRCLLKEILTCQGEQTYHPPNFKVSRYSPTFTCPDISSL